MLASIIPTRVHGVLDYLVGLLLIAAPWLFGFADNHAAMMVPVVLGIGTLIYSLITNYELGVVHLLPMRADLWIDLMAGVLLAASPWIFNFASRIAWPHVAVGVMEIVIVLISSPVPALPRSTTTGGSNLGQPGVV